MQKSSLPLWIALFALVLLVALGLFWRPAVPPNVAPTRPAAAAAPTTPAPDLAAERSAACFDAFDAWRRDYLAASPSDRPALLAPGLALAKARREEMARLIVADPAVTLARAVPRGERAGLPPELQPLLETPVDATGMLGLAMACGHSPSEHAAMGIDDAAAAAGLVPSHGIWRDAVFGETTYRAHVYGRRLAQKTLENVPLHGIALDGQMAVSAAPSRRLEAGEPGFRADAVTVQAGRELYVFPTEAEASAFENSLVAAEAAADGPIVRYAFPSR